MMDTPPRMPSEEELRQILNYSIVALIGMLAGLSIGYVFGQGVKSAPQGQLPTNRAAAVVPAAAPPAITPPR